MVRRVCSLAVVWMLGTGAVVAQTVPPHAFRLYLVDGTEVATHGEASRVGDDVVAMVPVGPAAGDGPPLQAVTLPAATVDWQRTEAYLDAVRLAQYAEASGERDYAAFTADIAATLDRVSSTPDPLARITMVQDVRARLAAWPAEHYGYRQSEATAMLSMLDEVLIGLRAAAGQREFTLALSTGTPPAPAPPPPLERAPTLQDVVSQALGLARHLPAAAEREALLARTLAVVEAGPDTTALPDTWQRDARRTLGTLLDRERRVSRAYASLRARVVERAGRHAAAADVRALVDLRTDAGRRDERLGHQRPDEMRALLAHLDRQLEDARRLRLALDRWQARRPVIQPYARALARLLETADPIRAALDDVRTLSGPPLQELDKASAILHGLVVSAGQLRPPDEGRALHDLLTSGLQMASGALARRRAATLAGSLPQAWEASAGAAGALLVFDRVARDRADLLQPPAPGAPAVSGAR